MSQHEFTTYPDSPRVKTIRDAVHFDIEIHDHELTVINTREFQRLRRVKQLGLANLVYPSATHTRFEHVLGVCHMAQRIINRINTHSVNITPEETRVIRYVALLHDIGHLPFGHTLEDERPVIRTAHDGFERLHHYLFETSIATALEAIERRLGPKDLRQQLLTILCGTKTDPEVQAIPPTARQRAFGNIVANTICADLLDYLKRDTLFTGIQHRYDDRILSSFCLEDDELYIDLTDDRNLRTGLLSEILHLLRLRYTLGERVYYHGTKAAASAMISKAVELLELGAEHLMTLGDDELLYVIENPSLQRDAFGREPPNDDAAAQAKRIVELIRKRDLYVPAYYIRRGSDAVSQRISSLGEDYHESHNIAKRRALERTLAAACGLTDGELIVFCPDPGMSLKAADVRVRYAQETETQLLELIQVNTVRAEISQIKQKHEDLWFMLVLIDPSKFSGHGQKVSERCEVKFGIQNELDALRQQNSDAVCVTALREAIRQSGADPAIESRLLRRMRHKRQSYITVEEWFRAEPEALAHRLTLGWP